MVQNLPANAASSIPGWERSPGGGITLQWGATHSSVLAWEIPWTGPFGGLQSQGSKDSATTEQQASHIYQSTVLELFKSFKVMKKKKMVRNRHRPEGMGNVTTKYNVMSWVEMERDY